MPSLLTEEAKKKAAGAYERFHRKLVSIKQAHFHKVDAIQKEADQKFADTLKQNISQR